MRPATLLKTRLWHKCSPVNFAKFHRAPPVSASETSRDSSIANGNTGSDTSSYSVVL